MSSDYARFPNNGGATAVADKETRVGGENGTEGIGEANKVTLIESQKSSYSQFGEGNQSRPNSKERMMLKQEILTLKDLVVNLKEAGQDRECKAREAFERQLNDVSNKKDAELNIQGDVNKNLKDLLSKTQSVLKGEELKNQKFKNERDVLYSERAQLQQECEEKEMLNESISIKSHEYALKLKATEGEIILLKDNQRIVIKAKQVLTKANKSLNESKTTSEVERSGLRSANSHLIQNLGIAKKELVTAAKVFKSVVRERDVSQKNLLKSSASYSKQYSKLIDLENNKNTLIHELSAHKSESQKTTKSIDALKRERNKCVHETSGLREILEEVREVGKMKDVTISDGKLKAIEFEKKSKEQRALYENVRTDRNLYSKNLLESQDEISKTKQHLKILDHQVAQLKEENIVQETVLLKGQFDHSKLEKEKEALQLHVSKLQQLHSDANQTILDQQSEEIKYRNIIAQADVKGVKREKEFESIRHKKDVMSTQLFKKSDQLTILSEKVKIQTSTLNKGEHQYGERVEDIRFLQLEIKTLRRENAMLQAETQSMSILRKEMFEMQNNIINERIKVKSLEEELRSPMNIHRWRKLAGSDPNSFALISKIQKLQKQVIGKNSDLNKKDRIVQEQKVLYTEVKKSLDRQPSISIVGKLHTAQAIVKSKVRESQVYLFNKALTAEMKMYSDQVRDFKSVIEKLQDELHSSKEKYLRLQNCMRNAKVDRIDAIPELFITDVEELKTVGKKVTRHPIGHNHFSKAAVSPSHIHGKLV